MILSCPECATSYFVDDSRVPESGRTVRCSNCGARWKAAREVPTAALAAESPPPPQPEPAVEVAAETVEPAAIPPEEVEVVAVEPELVIPPRPRRAPPTTSREATGKVAVWASAAALVAGLVAGAIIFRGEVVRLWPKSSATYAGLGLPVNGLGLVIEGVRAEPTFQGGRPVLSVTGAIRNVKQTAVVAPALRISLLNHSGKPVAAKVVRPIDPRVPAGATRHFTVAISDPPSNARDLEVMFDAEPARAAAAQARIPVAPAPVEAQPLPPGTPESLSEHG